MDGGGHAEVTGAGRTVRSSGRILGAAPTWSLGFGATVLPGAVAFRIWAPGHTAVAVVLEDPAGEHALAAERDGWFSGRVDGIGAGARYRFRLDGGALVPDPASRYQPAGVHGPSQVVDPSSFRWSDGTWLPPSLEELVLYEAHVGTATPAGTFESLIAHLDDLAQLGVNALELMPVAQFGGRRNWGYDGVLPYAPAECYGGPEGLRRLVEAAHARGLAVVLDVVYNHLGPEGNYLPEITSGRFFTRKHRTPWGAGINFDDDGSEVVREFYIQNALYWIHEFHVDGLRLDATHTILDDSRRHFLQELAERVQRVPRAVLLMGEDERNDRRLLLPRREGGCGLDAVWADDFHHQMRSLLAGDDEGYYRAYTGSTADIARTLERGWFYEGQPFQGAPRGTPAGDLPPQCFIYCLQNHDQVGNRALGERLSHQVDAAAMRAASALLLLSPFTPLIWMGQEWAASTPFLYFTDHPEDLGRLVTKGRREEFRQFRAFADPQLRERIPDPQDPETFRRCVLAWDEREVGEHAGMLRLYRELLGLRRTERALRERLRGSWTATAPTRGAVALARGSEDEVLLLVANFEAGFRLPAADCLPGAPTPRRWSQVLSTEDARFGGGGGCGLEEDDLVRLSGTGALLLRGVVQWTRESCHV